MKRLFVFAVLTCAIALSACHNTDDELKDPTLSKIEEILGNRTSEPDLTAFLKTLQNGVWMYDDYCLFFTNGEMESGPWDGGAPLHHMMFLPDGECRIFLSFMSDPRIPRLYQAVAWSVSDRKANTIELYSEEIARDAETNHFDQYAAVTTLELLYYQDGVFIMKGMQPFAYDGGMTSQGIYKDHCMIYGHIATDQETVEKFRAYESYNEYREQHPGVFPDR